MPNKTTFNNEVNGLIRIGMLHHRKDPRTVIKAYPYAAIAKAEGAEFIYFSPKRVNFNQKTILGYIYENGDWQERELPFPDVIYNAGSPEKLNKSIEIINRLKESIPFTTHSIGNKMNVYKRLKEAGEFSQYLIPSEIVKDSRHFFDFLDLYRKVVLKPVNGRKGQDINLIERIGDQFRLLKGNVETIQSYEELGSFINDKLKEESHIVQPYLNCRTTDGNPFDFRLHVQKNGEGKWVITSIYPRIGPSGTIVSNINQGGSMNYLEPFLKQQFGNDFFNIKRYLEKFALQLAEHIEELQQKHFSESIDELGIDAALDNMKKLWIYEVNWRPGCPPTFYLEMDVVQNMIRYCKYLANEHHKADLLKGVGN